MNFLGVAGEWEPGLENYIYYRPSKWKINVARLSNGKPLFVGQFCLEESEPYLGQDIIVSLLRQDLEEEKEEEQRELERRLERVAEIDRRIKEENKRRAEAGPKLNEWIRFVCQPSYYWRTSYTDRTQVAIVKPPSDEWGNPDLDSPNWEITGHITKHGFGEGDWILIVFSNPDKVDLLGELIKELYGSPGKLVYWEDYFQLWRKDLTK